MDKKFSERLSKGLTSVKPGEVCLLTVNSDNTFIVRVATLASLTKSGKNGIHVCIELPLGKIVSDSKVHGVEHSKLFFVDCSRVRQESGGKAEISDKNCVHLASPKNLTQLSILINSLVISGKFDFLFFDSISTLALYNQFETVQKFAQYLFNKMRLFKIRGIIFCIQNDKKDKFAPLLASLCDKSFDFS